MSDELTRRIFELATRPELRERYKLDRALGRGAMGVVLAGEQVSTGRRVAVKFMIELDDQVAVQRMEREGQLLARVAHPGLTRILDSGTIDGYPYLVTELMTGDTLDDRIQNRGRLPLDEAMQVCREVLPALQACHDANVVHRDLKPQNILYDHDGRARLADLGVARWLDAQRSLTATGQVIGTPLYVAPELLRAELATPASDIYGIGCTIFEMLTGQPPFEGPTLPELLKRQMHEPPPRADVLVPSVPTAIAEIVDRTLAKSPADRPASATELLEALEMALLSHRELEKSSAYVAPRPHDPHAAETHGALSIPEPPPPRPPSRPDRPRNTGRKVAPVPEPPPPARGRLAFGLFVTGLIVGGALLAPRPSPPPPSVSPSPSSPQPSASSLQPPALRLTDGDAILPPGAVGRIGSYWGSHPQATYLRVSPDGGFLATANPTFVRVWDLTKKRLLTQWRSALNHIRAVEIAPGGARTVVAVSSERMSRITRPLAQTPENAPPMEIVVRESRGGKPRTVASVPYCGAWALAPGAGHAGWFDALSGRLAVVNLSADGTADFGAAVRPRAMAVSPDGQRIALVTDKGGEVRDRQGGTRPLPVAGGTEIAWSPDGARLAVGSADGVIVLEASSLNALYQVPQATTFAWEPRGERLAVRTPDAIEVRGAKGAPVARHERSASPFALAGEDLIVATGGGFHADEASARRMRVAGVDAAGRFAVVDRDGLAAWHFAGARVPLAQAGGGWALAGIARDGRNVHLRQRRPGEADDLVRVVDADTGAVRAEVPVPGSATYVPLTGARGLLIHPNLAVETPGPGGGRKLLTAARLDRPGSQKLELCALDRAERKLLLGHPERGLVMLDLLADELRVVWRKEMIAVTGLPNAAVFRNGAREVVMSSSDEVLHVQDTQGLKPARIVKGPLLAIKQLAQSADDTKVIGGDGHGGIAVWELPGGQVRLVAPMVGSIVRGLGIDPDGRILAVDDDGVLTVWK